MKLRGGERVIVATWALLALVSFLGNGCGTVITPVPTRTPIPNEAVSAVRPTVPPSASEFLTPIPPTPTLTPSPTPTPVMHVVESGDTLFGIALDYGVTLDALLAANGIGADAILSIGQQIIIPTEEQGAPVETTGMVAPVENLILPTPTPLPLDVRGVAYYRTAVGGGWCMGEVVNTTDGPITNLQVEVSVANGEILLLSGVTRAAADYLPAGARAPFALLFQEAPGGDVSVEARLLRAEPIGAITAGFKPLAVSETTGGVSGPQYRVGGRLTNDAGVALDRVTVVVTLYDEEGRVLGYREEPVREGGGVASDESLSFEILLTPQGVGNPDSFSVLAWGSQL